LNQDHQPPIPANIYPGHGTITSTQRADQLGHSPLTVWFTGLSGSGKSTLAFAVEELLIGSTAAAYVLDGDNVRAGLNSDLGFSPEDRTENIRRIGEVCLLMADAGLVVLASFISPYRTDRSSVRALHPQGRFVEVFVDTPIEICEQRDAKGLYARARAGEIPDFSGVSAPYEPPESPELRVDTSTQTIAQCAQAVFDEIRRRI
jgi:adenylyl-sulfate kinase